VAEHCGREQAIGPTSPGARKTEARIQGDGTIRAGETGSRKQSNGDTWEPGAKVKGEAGEWPASDRDGQLDQFPPWLYNIAPTNTILPGWAAMEWATTFPLWRGAAGDSIVGVLRQLSPSVLYHHIAACTATRLHRTRQHPSNCPVARRTYEVQQQDGYTVTSFFGMVYEVQRPCCSTQLVH
jgi:hypothetical protein